MGISSRPIDSEKKLRMGSVPMLAASSSPDASPVTSAHLWLVGVALMVALLLTALAAIVLRRHRANLQAQFERLDAFLADRMPRPWHFLKRRFSRHAWYGLALTLSTLVVVGALALFVHITDGWVDREALYAIDQAVDRKLEGVLNDRLQYVITTLTYLGGIPFALMLSGVLALWFLVRRRGWRLLALLTVVWVGEGVLWLLKDVFSRARPENVLSPEGASFPSGHAFTAVVLYGFCIVLLWRHTTHPALRAGGSVALVLLILSLCVSRILLGVHWVSDVLGGFVLGLGWLVFALVATRTIQAYAERPSQQVSSTAP